MGTKLEVQKVYNLSPMQEGILFHSLMEGDSHTYFEQITFTLQGEVNVEILEQSFKSLINRYDIFRTNFVHVGTKKPQQVVLKDRSFKLLFEDISYLEKDVMDDFLRKFTETDKNQKFDLSKDMLMRVAIFKIDENSYKLIWSFHHILIDGWCVGIILKEIIQTYTLIKMDKPVVLEKAPSYLEYIKWIEKQNKDEAIEYWKSALENYTQKTVMPRRKQEPEISKYEHQEIQFNLDKKITRKLKELSQKYQVTLNTVIQAIWGILLQRYTNGSDVVFGAVVSGRSPEIPSVEKMVGLFINTVPVRIQDNNVSFVQLIKNLQLAALSSEKYSYYPLYEIQAQSQLKQELFDHIIVFENYPVDKEIRDFTWNSELGFQILDFHAFEQTNYSLNLIIVPGTEIGVRLNYNSLQHEHEFINRIADHFNKVITAILENPNVEINHLDIISMGEKNQLLNEFNDTKMDYLSANTVHKQFENQVLKTPENIAVVFKEIKLTYRELNERANSLARTLRLRNVGPNNVVGLMVERSVEFIVGLLAIMKAGGAYVPIDPEYPIDRINYMLIDSGAKIVLSQSSLINRLKLEKSISIPGEWIDLADSSLYDADTSNLQEISQSENLLYVIYTSGTTGQPKGVMLKHRNLVNLLSHQQKNTNIPFNEKVLQFTTISFDVCYQEIFSTLFAGGHLYLINNETKQNTDKLLEFINDNQIQVVFFPVSFLKFVFNEEEYLKQFPDCVQHIITAGEQLVVSKTLQSFLREKNVFLHNHYGPSETHVVTTYTISPFGKKNELPPIGKPIANTNAYLLDEHQNLQPMGTVGELYISGDNVGGGYIGNPELTHQKFINNPFKPGEIMYRTGDLARWLPNGELEFLGRKDKQVKIRGYRIELGEIEAHLLNHPLIHDAAVVDLLDDKETKYLCAYICFATDQEENHDVNLREYLQGKLPIYMIPSFFIPMEILPLTQNGKLNRIMLPVPSEVTKSKEDYEVASSILELKMVDIWKQVLGINRIGVKDDFFDLGGHSLKVMMLVSQIHKHLQVELSLDVIFKYANIRDLAKYINKQTSAEFMSIEPVLKQAHYPLSSAQKRLYILHQMDTSATSYNIPGVMELNGKLDLARLENAFQSLIERHESLRTSFDMVNGEPVQIIHSEYDFQVSYHVVPEKVELDKILKDFIKPFDLKKAPLIRVNILRIEEERHLLLIDTHHIISDGISSNILFKELGALYKGNGLVELRLQYKDYAVWQNERLLSDDMRRHEKYWLEAFSGEIPVLNLPTEYARPAMQSFKGSSYVFLLNSELTRSLKKLAVETGTTLYMVMLAAYNVLLYKYTNQMDIVVGTPIAGRSHADLNSIVGMFVNTLPIRNQPEGNKNFLDFLVEVKLKAMEAFAHQEYPFENLVEKINLSRDFSRNPLFDTMFMLQNFGDLDIEMEGLSMRQYEQETHTAKFDMTFMALETNDSIKCYIEYSDSLYGQQSICRLAEHFKQIVKDIANNSNKSIDEINIMTIEEKKNILLEFNKTSVLFPKDKSIHRLFEERVEQKPEQVALVLGDKEITYRELNERANQLARILLCHGVYADQIVGVMMDRSIEMIVAILGTLKAGGAYLPIDPTYPEERVRYMLEDSGTSILLTQDKYMNKDLFGGKQLNLNDNQLYTGEFSNLEVISYPRQLAYVIYTSGSTGKPKGVMIEHQNVQNFIQGITNEIDFGVGNTILALTTISFDIFLLETLLPLVKGIRIVIATENQQNSPEALNELIIKNNINIIQITPSRMQLLINDDRCCSCLANIQIILMGGEALSHTLLEKVKNYSKAKIYNMYGPTETTVWSTMKEVTNSGNIQIGKPISNTQIYILDDKQQIVPIGVSGELCISGAGLARGYLNRPELTEEKFVVNPYQSGQKMYRTGDLARWLPDGNLEYIGRMDHQVKIRGYRIELAEIESELMGYEAIIEAVVIPKEMEKGKNSLYAYIKASKEIEAPHIRSYLAEKLPLYMVPDYFIKVDEMPLTPNGKVDRKSLLQIEISPDMRVKYEAPRNELEQSLSLIWQEVLNLERVGILENFFELGGNSILMVQINSRINRELKVNLALRDLLVNANIEKLASFMADHDMVPEVTYPEILPDPEHIYEPFPLTDVQVAYLMGRNEAYEMGGGSTHGYAEIETKMDILRFNLALQKVIDYHPMMRAIVLPSGEQKILKEVSQYQINVQDLTKFSELEQQWYIVEERKRMSHNVFKTDQWPLFEFRAFKLSLETFYLFIGFDVLIMDATSMKNMVKMLMDFYNDPEYNPPQLEFTFRDYILAYHDFKNSETYKSDKKYWLDKLDEFPSAPILPLKQDPEKVKQPRFKRHSKMINKTQWEQLKKKAQQHHITPSALLCAAYAKVMSFWSNQSRLAINLTVFNRYPFHKDVNQIVGDFTSVMLLDIDFGNFLTFWKQAEIVQTRLLESLEHRHYDGVEFIRNISNDRQLGTRAAAPVVFTSMLFGQEKGEETNQNPLGEVKFSATQTSQVFIDNQVSENNGNLVVIWDYVEQLFDPEVIDTMFIQYIEILNSLLENKYEDYQISCREEEQLLLEAYNHSEEEIPVKTLHGMFSEQASKTPNHIALILGDTSLTYNELDVRSNQVAHYLKGLGVGSNQLVGVSASREIGAIVNLLGVLKTGAAYVPVDPEYPEDRISYILENSSCELMLEANLYEKENLALYPNGAITEEHHPDDLAYVIYTSGSTGRPKGVMITHQSAANTIQDINRKFNVSETDRFIGLSSMSFDLSVYDIFGALSTGASLVMVRDQRDVINLIEIIEEKGITIWNSVPAIMDMVLENVMDELKSSSLRLVMLSGDWIPLKLPSKVKQYFPEAKTISLGGATEAAIWSIYYPVEEVYSEWKSIPYGRPLANQTFYVLNYEMKLCPIGVEGELFIGGIGVAQGYMNDKEKTASSYIEHPEFGRLYRTGDFGVMNKNKYIEFRGRRDQQVKIRGYRIEIREIESCLLKHDFIQSAVVLDWNDHKGKKYLCAYFVADEELTTEELRIYLTRELPHYMVPGYFVQLDEISLTSNGKVNRKALPKPEIEEVEDYVAPSTYIERNLTKIWEEVLNHEKIGVKHNFFEIGGHSLNATILITRIHTEFNVDVPLRQLFMTPTIREVANYIESSNVHQFESIRQIPKQEYYPVSSAQKRMYVLHHLEGASLSYSGPALMTIKGELSQTQFERTFKSLISRHESLRTSFEIIDGELVQRVHDHIDFEIAYVKAKKDEIKTLVSEFSQPFELSKAPLLRVSLIDVGEEEHIMFFDMHHIITDATSMSIMINEFMTLYQGKVLPESRIQYKDFAVWQNEQVAEEAIKQQEQHWLDLFSDEIPVLNLPTDFPRPLMQSFEGERIDFRWDKSLTDSLKQLAKETNTTLYMVILAAYTTLLSKYTGQEDIIVGSPVAGRTHADTEQVIGLFINTLAMRNAPNGYKSFRDFLEEVKNNSVRAIENESYPLEELIAKLALERDTGRNPLFSVMFNMLNMEKMEMKLEQLSISPYPIHHKISKFDLSLEATEKEGELSLSLEYCTNLFKKETIERIIYHFSQIIQQIVSRPQIKINEIEMLTEKETHQILSEFTNTKANYSKYQTIHRLFEEQAEITPNHIAVVCENHQLTYRQLNEHSNQLARILHANGVKEDELVGIIADRSLEMIIGILAILKAGGAYLPIDTSYPKDRIQYMMDDSQIKLLLSQHRLELNVLMNNIKQISIDPDTYYHEDKNNLSVDVSESSLVYVYYTSGSTGRPKGVMIEHKNVFNQIQGITSRIPLNNENTILAITTISFDPFVIESLLALTKGIKVILATEKQQNDSFELSKLIVDHKIDVLQFTPSRIQLFMNSNTSLDFFKQIKILIIGGEALTPALLKRLREVTSAKIFNVYGPTETTVWSTVKEINNTDAITIGRPIPNQKIYIIDQCSKMQPIGVIGELCIAGHGLGRGYVNNSELTEERFVLNPFVPNELMYKTGDLARWLPDGDIEYLGRMDNQVKIRGHRIELGEIETVLLQYPLIKQASVLDHLDEQGFKVLSAYVVSEKEIRRDEIQTYLTSSLPSYMIPSYFIEVSNIPLSPNGKVNRGALQRESGKRLQGVEYVEPITELEYRIGESWKHILGDKTIGVYDNFFELGGHSLNAMLLANKLSEELSIEIPLKFVFQYPTINKMVNWVNALKENNDYSIKPIMLLNDPKEDVLFCFPPVTGNGFIFREMARSMNSHSLYALDFIEDNDRIEKYIELMVRLQGEKPYVLMGYSAGGNLIFELAKEMQRKGYLVSDLIIIDTKVIESKFLQTQEEIDEQANFMINYFTSDDKYYEFFGGVIKDNFVKRTKSFLSYLNENILSGTIDSRIHFIESRSTEEEDPKKWSERTCSSYLTYSGYGDHIEMLVTPYVELNAKLVNKILQGISFENNKTPVGGHIY